MESPINTAHSDIVRRLYIVRDTACGADTFEFTASHPGEALARLASVVVGTQRISFELYEVGHYTMVATELKLVTVDRLYVCSASQTMLDSFVEEVDNLLDPKESLNDSSNR